jgi:phenylacetate-CoA ligase
MWPTGSGHPLDPAETRRIQEKKLRSLIRHCYENVPYYHSLFRERGVDPSEIRTIDDLHKLPISTKRDIVDLPLEKTVASGTDPSKLWTARTSGTTGVPLTVYWDMRAKLLDYLVKARAQLERGDRIINKQVLIGTSATPDQHPFQRIGVFRAKRISELKDVETQIREIKAYDPRTMQASVSNLIELARQILEEDIKGIDIEQIFTGGEWLDESTRALAKEAFSAKVFNSYGSVEVGRIANGCSEHGIFHLNAETNLVEIVSNGEPVSTGEEGQVVVTNLNNYAMPFLRYNLEDIGRILDDDCSHGYDYPHMTLTEGRKADLIRLPNGRTISAMAGISALRPIQGIIQFQLTQEELNSFTVRIVKGRDFTETVVEEIRRALWRVVGDARVEVMIVDRIPRSPMSRGSYAKARQFITKVA